MLTSRVLAPVTIAAAAVLLAALSGCSTTPSAASGSTTPSPAASASQGGSKKAADIDACSLVTPAQVSSLTGQPFTDSTSASIAIGQDHCSYQSVNGPLSVTVYQPGSGVTWSTLTSVISNSGTPVAVSGIGDKAMEAGIEVDAQLGDRFIAVQGNDFNLPNTEAVAKAVVAALGK